MQALTNLLKRLTSLSRTLRGTPRRVNKSGPGQRPSRTFRPSFEVLEDRLVPSTTNLLLNINPILILGTPPAAPAFVASDTSASQINLSWKPVANASGYLVDEWVNGAWKQIANYGSGVSGVNVSGLSTSTTYYFDVAAYNSHGTTWANFQSITTIDHPTAGGAYSPVSGSLFGPNGPSYLDVEQGAVGDCWLEASLAEVAARQPGVIQSMFTYKGTEVENGATVGLYSVRLYSNSGTAIYETVDTELPSGGGLYDHPANGVLWVALAEKAYAEANGQRLVTTGNDGSDSYGALNDGDPTWALHAITGQSASDYSINPSNIVSAWNAGELIVLYTSNPPNSDIVPGHAYAVVGYNASSSLPFEVYNPWGTNSSGWALGDYNGHAVYGLFVANAAFLSQNFSGQSIAASPASMDGTIGTGFVQLTLDRSFTAGAGISQTGFVTTNVTTPTGTAPGGTNGSLLAMGTQQPDLLGRDALWADAGNPDSAFDSLGGPLLHLGV